MSRLVAVLVGLVASLLLLELGAWAAITRGVVAAEHPSGGDTAFWWGDHPTLGVWKRPGAEGELSTGCSRGTYRMNSVGARDVERPRRASEPRTVVLGDSFLEGWGLPEAERLSSRLERATGRPHLNFAMAHFGPWQSLLAYRELASGFDHDTVLLGLLPVNDFQDLDLATEYGHDYEYRYRPYLVPYGEGWEAIHHREPRLRRWLRHHSWLFQLVRSVRARGAAPPAPVSGYLEASDRQLAVLEEVLVRTARATEGKRLVVLVIPARVDFEAVAASEGRSAGPLLGRLRAVAAREGFEVLDLLPPMAEHTRSVEKYFLPCDYHWSRYGNRIAAGIVAERLYR